MSKHIWTEAAPQVPGYYWYKFKDCDDIKPCIALLFDIDGQLYARSDSTSSPHKLVRFMRGVLWAGPVEEPTDLTQDGADGSAKKAAKSVPGATKRVPKPQKV